MTGNASAPRQVKANKAEIKRVVMGVLAGAGTNSFRRMTVTQTANGDTVVELHNELPASTPISEFDTWKAKRDARPA